MIGYISVAAPLRDVGQEDYEGISARSSEDIYKAQILSRGVEVDKSYATTGQSAYSKQWRMNEKTGADH